MRITTMDVDQKQPTAEVDEGITLVAKYGKAQHVFENVSSSTTVSEVKQMLSDITRILPKRQKLIGLAASSGKVADDMPLSMLKVKKTKLDRKIVMGMTFILMGTPEEHILVDPMDRDDLPEVIDDFDLDFNAGSTEVSAPSIQSLTKDCGFRMFSLKLKSTCSGCNTWPMAKI